MHILDTALQKLVSEGKEIRVGMVGAGFMAKGIALQLAGHTPGIRLVAIANRTLDKAKVAYSEAGVSTVEAVENEQELDEAYAQKKYSMCSDPHILCRSNVIDVLIEVTGTIEYAAHIVMDAFKHGKHVIAMNAELDGTIGPILKTYADKAGVVFTNADGDQPGVEMNLYRFVKGMGVTPVMCGNIKGLQDPYRTPETQRAFAEKWGQNPSMVTSFADGSKISFEQAVVANATGMKVAKRGMYGPTVASGTPLVEAMSAFDTDAILQSGGIVDYVVGPVPNGGIFVLGTHDNPKQQHYLNLYKVGEGPLYCFYNPYHLCHFEIQNTVARTVLFHDPTITPKGKPYVEVIATAKRDLKAGETLDPIGHFMTYGECENASTARQEDLLPIGLAEDCVLKNDVSKDEALKFSDVVLPEGRLCDKLWEEQLTTFA